MPKTKASDSPVALLPTFRVHRCGIPDVEIRPLESAVGERWIVPIYVKDVCGGESIIEIYSGESKQVQVCVFHSCRNHIGKIGVEPTTDITKVFPHEESILKRIAKDG